MKRQFMTAAMIGTSILAIANQATAKDCIQVKGKSPDTIECREIKSTGLGQPYCVKPDGFNIRAMLHGTSPDPWITNTPISLQTIVSHSASCHGRQHILGGSILNISENEGKYFAKISSQQGTVEMEMQMVHDGSNQDVFLKGNPTHSLVHYYIFLRNDAGHSRNLPKFAYVEAFDFADDGCANEAPELSKNVKPGNCQLHPEVAKDGRPVLFESGVGGGGENP